MTAKSPTGRRRNEHEPDTKTTMVTEQNGGNQRKGVPPLRNSAQNERAKCARNHPIAPTGKHCYDICVYFTHFVVRHFFVNYTSGTTRRPVSVQNQTKRKPDPSTTNELLASLVVILTENEDGAKAMVMRAGERRRGGASTQKEGVGGEGWSRSLLYTIECLGSVARAALSQDAKNLRGVWS